MTNLRLRNRYPPIAEVKGWGWYCPIKIMTVDLLAFPSVCWHLKYRRHLSSDSSCISTGYNYTWRQFVIGWKVTYRWSDSSEVEGIIYFFWILSLQWVLLVPSQFLCPLLSGKDWHLFMIYDINLYIASPPASLVDTQLWIYWTDIDQILIMATYELIVCLRTDQEPPYCQDYNQVLYISKRYNFPNRGVTISPKRPNDFFFFSNRGPPSAVEHIKWRADVHIKALQFPQKGRYSLPNWYSRTLTSGSPASSLLYATVCTYQSVTISPKGALQFAKLI